MGPDTACHVYVAAASLITDRRNMPASQPESDSDFGAAFTALMDAAGISPDRLVARLAPGLVSRSTLYHWRKGQHHHWRKGQHLPEDTRPLLDAIALCLRAARDRKAALAGMPRDQDGWLRLLAAAKQARDSRGAPHRRSPDRRPHPVLPCKLIGEWDPASLGVHRAVGGRSLPGYVRRHHDDLLNSALQPQAHGSRLVVLRGGSSTGKSRAAYQAVNECLPSWRVDYPRTPAALEQRLRDGVAPRSVIWLGELRDYVERADGPVALDLLADLLDSDRQIVVITTLWHEHWASYTASRANGPGAPHPGSAIQAVLTALPELRVQGETPSRGAVIDVPDRFTQSEVTLALQQKDPVVRDAVTAAAAAGARGEITQYLAGVPDLLKQYEGAGRDPYGQAILTAAVDAARLGHPGPYTPKLLRDAVSGYLTDRQRTADISGWWDNAMAYCTEELNGAVRALEPVPPAQGTGIAGYRLADYLEQHGRHSRQGHRCPVTLWDSLIANTTAPGHLTRLAWAAYSRGLYRLASLLSKRAISLGEDNPGAFVLLLPKLGPDDARRASLWVADRIAVKDPNDLQLWKLLKGREVEAGLGQEAAEKARPVLHPPQPGLHQRGQLIDVMFGQVGQRSLQVRPDRLNRVQLRRVGRQLEDGQPVPGRDQLVHRAAGMGVQAVPDQDHGTVQLLVGSVQEPGVIRLGEPLALISPPCAVRAEDQPGTAAGPDGDQRGQRHPRVMPASYLDYGGMAAAPPGASLRRPQALAGLVFPAEPGAQVRRRAFMTGQVSSRHLAILSSSRSAARRAGTCTDHPIRCSSTSIPASVYAAPNRRQAWSATRASVQHWSAYPHAAGPASRTSSSSAT
jgi:hypothetical protein